MARAAGSKPGYTFVLRNENTGRYMKDVSITLPSSTTIIKSTLAAPQLVPWAYRTTRDNISGMVDQLQHYPEVDNADIIDMLTDADWLEEYLKDNKLRPDDVRDASADRGTDAHALLEQLGNLAVDGEDERAHELAVKHSTDKDLTKVAVSRWWIDTHPHVLASEMILPCPTHGYCGTTDLVQADRVTDLKTRRAGLYVYESDEYQVDSYRIAWNLLHPEYQISGGSVLLAFDDGTYLEQPVRLEPGAFLDLKRVWDQMLRLKAQGRR